MKISGDGANPNRISVFEHQALKINKSGDEQKLKPTHLKALEKYHGDKGTPYFTLIRDGVKFNKFVGVLKVGNLAIEVLPKADQVNDEKIWRDILIDMLKKVGTFNIKAPSKTHLKTQPNHLLDLYFELYVSEVEIIFHKGLVKNYLHTEKNLGVLKGSINFSKHVTVNAIHQERFYTRHSIYDRNIVFNQIIYKALLLLKKLNSNPMLSSRINVLLFDSMEVSDIKITEDLFNRLKFSRKTEHYRNAIEIARLLLLNYHPDLNSGNDHVLALMFDMNLLWERFVYVSLRKFMHPEFSSIHPQLSKPFWRLDGFQPVKLKPDIVGMSLK